MLGGMRIGPGARAWVVAMALALAACSSDASTTPSPSLPDASGSDARPTGDGGGGAAEAPAALPAPAVGVGACTEVTYTPPGAPTPQEGELCRPPADVDARDVGVVLLHGGSGTAGRWSDLDGWVDAYLGAGITTLNVDYELFRPGREDDAVFPRPEQDVKAAVQYLRGVAPALGVEEDRIVVHGTSSGARIGAVAFTTPDDPSFAGPELWSGISDRVDGFVGFYHPYDGSLQGAATYYGGERDDEDTDVRRRWYLADALLHAEDATGPAAFFTGERDWEVQITQAQELAAVLEEHGHDASVTVVARAGHGFDLSGGGLTKAGQQVAYVVTQWLEQQFPPAGR
jgi:acetyl esterase/lipase